MKTKCPTNLKARRFNSLYQFVIKWSLLYSIGALLVISCTKSEDLGVIEIINDSPIDNNVPITDNNPPNNNGVSTNSSGFNIGAGPDKLVFLPNRSCTLYGWASYQANNPPVKYKWDKIAGPESFLLVSPDSLGTTINELEKGVYEFEVTCTMANGYMAKDTCSVIVGQLSSPSNFIVFNNQNWSGDGLLWGSQIEIPDIYQYIPIGSVFKVFMKRQNLEAWVELMFEDDMSLISVALLKGNLKIYSNIQENDSPDIKIEY